MNIFEFKKFLINLKHNNIKITTADKNIGTVLIDNDIYNELCFQHLMDTKTYKELNESPQFLVVQKTKNLIYDLNLHGHITDKLLKIFNSNILCKRLANFRILIKLHKTKFGIRPLINCSNITISIITKFIDFYIKPYILNNFSYIKDSQNLIQKLNHKKIENNNSFLHSADFESLYTNIPIDEVVDNIMFFISKHSYSEFSNYGFSSLLKFILYNNYFYFKFHNKKNFNYKFFLQVDGIPMGTSCSPSIANLYLQFHELKYSHLLNKTIYFRFIDDIFYTDNNLNNYYKEIFPKLNLTITTGKIVQFLDVNIKYDLDSKFNFDLFIKKTNTLSYLNTKSNHKDHIFKGIITGLVHRIKRICSDSNQYYYHTNLLLSRLLNKGYNFKMINSIIRNFASQNRETLIEYRDKTFNFNNNIIFLTKFDKNFENIQNFYTKKWNTIVSNNEFSIVK